MEELPGQVSVDSNMSAQFVEYNSKQPKFEKDPSDHIIQSPISTPSSTGVACALIDPSESPLRQRRSIERRASRKGNKDAIRKAEGNILEGSDQSSRSRVTSSTSCCTIPSSEPSTRNKVLSLINYESDGVFTFLWFRFLHALFVVYCS